MSPKAAKMGKTTVRSLADQRSPMPAAAFDSGGDAKQPEKKLRRSRLSDAILASIVDTEGDVPDTAPACDRDARCGSDFK